MTDVPPELDRVPQNPGLANILQIVFEGANLIAIHPEKALVGVWHGGPSYKVYDPDQWAREGGYDDERETGEVYYFNAADPSQVDDPREYARETLERYGFEVVGE